MVKLVQLLLSESVKKIWKILESIWMVILKFWNDFYLNLNILSILDPLPFDYMYGICILFTWNLMGNKNLSEKQNESLWINE